MSKINIDDIKSTDNVKLLYIPSNLRDIFCF